jgi:hypothetical protein
MGLVRYLWLGIIALSLIPVAFACFLFNPITLWVLGPQAWREQVLRLQPYRWWLASSLALLTLATFVYGAQYGW